MDRLGRIANEVLGRERCTKLSVPLEEDETVALASDTLDRSFLFSRKEETLDACSDLPIGGIILKYILIFYLAY